MAREFESAAICTCTIAIQKQFLLKILSADTRHLCTVFPNHGFVFKGLKDRNNVSDILKLAAYSKNTKIETAL
jgi:hypothetical protein